MEKNWQLRFWFLIDYEPSWFLECASSIAIILWGLLAITADNFTLVSWRDYVLPIFGFVIGGLGVYALFQYLVDIRSLPRVMLTFARDFFWILVASALYHTIGRTPAISGYAVPIIGETLLIVRWSAPYSKQAIKDLRMLWRRKNVGLDT